jgi:hypothetical protein
MGRPFAEKAPGQLTVTVVEDVRAASGDATGIGGPAGVPVPVEDVHTDSGL